jgi:hypothetical protein
MKIMKENYYYYDEIWVSLGRRLFFFFYYYYCMNVDDTIQKHNKTMSKLILVKKAMFSERKE